ncbi:MAG: hypothetical protein MJ247_00625 [Alphaproteobacteria bacterium]|nr:hypothetical protein [Alphaproteobacteria bacterium]
MQDLEYRVEKLEKKCRTLKRCVIGLTCCAVLAGLSGRASVNTNANAAGEELTAKDVGIPSIVEAQIFMLKDSGGNIRGIWTADDMTTSFAMMHKGKFPIISMAVDNKNASMSLTDVYKGKINLGLQNNIRSISVADETGKNNIYMGLSGSGEASLDMVSTGSSQLAIDGQKASIDLTGDRAVVALAETVGSAVAIQAQPSASSVVFLDHKEAKTVELSTIDGKTKLMMNSPVEKQEKTIDTTKDKIIAVDASVEETAEKDAGKVSTEGSEGKDAEKSEAKEKEVDLKDYSPFSK